MNRIWPSSTRHKNCTTDGGNGNIFSSKRKDSKRHNYETVQTIMEDETMNFGKDLKELKKLFE